MVAPLGSGRRLHFRDVPDALFESIHRFCRLAHSYGRLPPLLTTLRASPNPLHRFVKERFLEVEERHIISIERRVEVFQRGPIASDKVPLPAEKRQVAIESFRLLRVQAAFC